MQQKNLELRSDGHRLDASLFLPDAGVEDRRPVVIACSGFTGLKEIHPARFARGLTARGYSCVGFDYRGFGTSDGARNVVFCEEQVRDIANTVAWVAGHTELGGRPLFLLGWGMGGGLVLQAAALVREQLAGLLAINGFYDAVRVQRAVRGEEGWRAFRAWLAEQRRAAVLSPEPVMVDPFAIYPLDPVSRGYVDGVLRKVDGYGGEVNLGFADSLLAFRPEDAVSALGDLPLLIAHGSQNELHPTEEARALEKAYPGPVTVEWLEGGGHTEWMDDENPIFRRLVDRIDAWLQAR